MKVLLSHKRFVLFTICICIVLLKIDKILLLTSQPQPVILLETSTEQLLKKLFNVSKVPETEQEQILSAGLPSLPYLAWKANKDKRWVLKCGQYPYIYDVPFYNTYWQTVKMKNYTFQLYGAYYDDRPIFEGKAHVMLYAFINAYMPNVNGLQGNQSEPLPAYCQLWFDSQVEPVVVNVTQLRYTWRPEWGYDTSGHYEGHMLTCEIPSAYRDSVPSSVTLVDEECAKGTNHLKVVNERPAANENKTNFAVCVRNQAYPFQDKALRFIEWIEIQLAMGASKIYFYLMDTHPNIEKVLRYYEGLGKVQVSYMSYPSGAPNVHGLPLLYLQHQTMAMKWETISLNDCYYRNMYKHNFIAILDTDEIIMPKMHYQNWDELFDGLEQELNITLKSYNAISVLQSYFLHYPDKELLKDIPNYLYTFQHVDRVAEFSDWRFYAKSIHNTANCLVMHNHYPMYCFDKVGWCNNHIINSKFAQLNHYRHDCRRTNNTCELDEKTLVKDMNIYKFKERVVPKILQTIDILNEL